MLKKFVNFMRKPIVPTAVQAPTLDLKQFKSYAPWPTNNPTLKFNRDSLFLPLKTVEGRTLLTP